MKDFVEWAFVIVVLTMVVGGMFAAWWDSFGRDWLRLRSTIRVARSYDIEYVPGEDFDKLRDRIIAKRDKLL